mgnify:CR=1 FL=1
MFEDKESRIAIIGDPDLLLLFQLFGLKIFPARNEAEAREALKEIEAGSFELCLIQQNYYFLINEKESKKRKGPVFLPFRDYRQGEDLIEEEIKKMMIRATGSDALLKKGR